MRENVEKIINKIVCVDDITNFHSFDSLNFSKIKKIKAINLIKTLNELFWFEFYDKPSMYGILYDENNDKYILLLEYESWLEHESVNLFPTEDEEIKWPKRNDMDKFTIKQIKENNLMYFLDLSQIIDEREITDLHKKVLMNNYYHNPHEKYFFQDFTKPFLDSAISLLDKQMKYTFIEANTLLPIFFLVVHSIELFLKTVTLHIDKSFEKTHILSSLLKDSLEIKKYINEMIELLKIEDDLDLIEHHFLTIETFIKKYGKTYDSMSTRYPSDKNGKKHKYLTGSNYDTNVIIDTVILRKELFALKKAYKFVFNTLNYINDCYQEMQSLV